MLRGIIDGRLDVKAVINAIFTIQPCAGLAAVSCLAACLLPSACAVQKPALAGSVPPLSGIELYISPAGDDLNSGSKDAPFRTLEAARDALRNLRAEGELAEPSTVYLREGTYRLPHSFRLEMEDSGTEDARITYRAYPGQRVRFLGGYKLSADQFTPISDPDIRRRIIEFGAAYRVLEIDLRALGITDYGQISRRGYFRASDLSKTPPMQLFVDSKPQQLARWPNSDTVQMNEISDPGPLAIPVSNEELTVKNKILAEKNPVYAKRVAHLTDGAMKGRIPAPTCWGVHSPELHQRGGTFSYTYDRPERWGQANDIWVAGVFGFSWEWSYNRVKKVNPESRSITLAYGEMSGLNKNWFPDFHHFENLLEELDCPGEYYIDRAAGKLYFYPPAGWNSETDITVSITHDPLIDCRDVSFVTFEGIDLGTGRNAAIVVRGGEGIELNKLQVRSVAGNGIIIFDGKKHAVVSCHIHDIGASAVLLGGGDWATLEPGENRVSHCDIHDAAYFSRVYMGAVVMSSASVGNIVENTRMYNLPHLAILVRGNDHLIEGNDISRVGEFADMGAIYLNQGENPSMRGTVIRRNFFHRLGHGKSHVSAVYPDNQTMGLTIEENIFFDIPGNAINVNSGSEILTCRNLFVDVKTPLRISYHSHGAHDYSAIWRALFKENDFYQMPHGKRYPELLRFFEEDRERPDTNTFEGNVLYNPNIPLKNADGIDHADRERLADKDTVILDRGNGFIRVTNGKLILMDTAALLGKEDEFSVWNALLTKH